MLGRALRRFRRHKRVNGKKVTVRDLALLLGVHYTTISAIERGKQQPSAELLRRWVEALGISIKDLEKMGPDLEEPRKEQRPRQVRIGIMARSFRDFLARKFLEDIRNEIPWELAGWRDLNTVDFQSNDVILRELQSQGLCKKVDQRVRINPDSPYTRTLEEIKQAKDLLRIRDNQMEEERRRTDAQQQLKSFVAALADASSHSWGSIVVAGLTAMLRASEAEAIIDHVLEEGFSPGDWPMVVWRSAPWAAALASQRSEWAIDSPAVAVGFFSRLGFTQLARGLVIPDDYKVEGEKIVKVLALDQAVRDMGKFATQALAFLWVAAAHIEHRSLLSLTEEGDARMEAAVWNLMAQALGQSETSIRDTLTKRLVDMTDENFQGRRAVGVIHLPWGI